MKVIRVDNFNREGPEADEQLMVQGLTEPQAKEVCEILRRGRSDHGADWYKVVPEDHVLWKFEP